MQRHWRVALATGLLAFGVAAAVLTLPELLFGDSVGGGGRTTIFGGKSSKQPDSERGRDEEKTKTEESQTTPDQTRTAPEDQQTGPDEQRQPQTTQPEAAPPPGAQRASGRRLGRRCRARPAAARYAVEKPPS